jgi:hypothetical protein
MLGGLLRGLVLYFAQGARSRDAVVIVIACAQVFVVSAAEVVVCWAVIGGILSTTFGGSSFRARAGAALVASALFGIYHFAHSPPFNTVEAVAFLSLIGLVTGLFFFLSRDVYATIVFPHSLGVVGVVHALAAAGELNPFRTRQTPLIATAIVALAVLLAADRLLLRRRGERARDRDED